MQQVDLSADVFRNPRKQGDIGLAAAIYHYTRLGYEVFAPLTEATRSDLVVIGPEGGPPIRVQCKTSRNRTRAMAFSVGLATAGGNRSWKGTVKTIDATQVDVVFVWCADDSTWLFPADKVAGRRSITCGWGTREFHVGGTEPRSPQRRASANASNTCVDCPATIGPRATRCRSCAASASNTRKFDWPPVADVKALIESEGSYLGAARVLGVSDNAIRKHVERTERAAAA